MIKVALNGIRIFAHHGFYEAEAILGNEFEIDIVVSIEMADNDSDDLKDTLNYEQLFCIIKSEMAERSKLLEHVLYRIKSNLINSYPDQIRGLALSIKKLNPPLGGAVESSEITLDENYESSCARCGRSHSCFNSKDCWCHSINLADVTREQLQRQYTGCLCDRCLNHYKSEPKLIIQT